MSDDSSNALGRGQVRGSTLLVLGRGTSMVIGMATQVIIVRVLTKEDFGAFAYAIALAAGARTLLSLGQGRLLSQFLARYEEERDYARMFGAMLLTVGTIAVTSVIVIGAFFLFTGSIVGDELDSPALLHLILILIFLSPLEALDQVFVSLFAVFSAPRAIFLRKYLMAPSIRLIVVVILAVTGASVRLLAIGYVVGGLLGLLLYTYLLLKALKERGLLKELRRSRVIIPYRAVLGFSLPLLTGELALLSFTVGGVVVLGLFHPIEQVANYRAVFSSARLNTAVSASFTTLFLPTMAKLHARGDAAGLRNTYWHTAAFVAVFTFPVFALTGPLAPATTVALFGQRYSESALILSTLAVGYYVNVILGFNTYTLQVCGRVRYLVVVNVFTAALNIGLCFALAPAHGALGVAMANCIALVVQNLLNQAALRRSIRTSWLGRSSWGCYAAIVAVSAALYLFQRLASPGLVLSLTAAAVGAGLVLVLSAPALRLKETFPELQRLPIIRRVVR
ncbi:MAG TPA: oligosaccharide flippase family protein [Marmoricola sp.]|nr:oligosaccharide flippase family protein [Marmoricola sp.]